MRFKIGNHDLGEIESEQQLRLLLRGLSKLQADIPITYSKEMVLDEYRKQAREERIRELELAKLEKELDTPKKPRQAVEHRNGTVWQGQHTYTFRTSVMISLINSLWLKRRQLGVEGSIIKPETSVSRTALCETMLSEAISGQQLASYVKQFNAAMKRKSINCRIRVGRQVFIEAQAQE